MAGRMPPTNMSTYASACTGVIHCSRRSTAMTEEPSRTETDATCGGRIMMRRARLGGDGDGASAAARYASQLQTCLYERQQHGGGRSLERLEEKEVVEEGHGAAEHREPVAAHVGHTMAWSAAQCACGPWHRPRAALAVAHQNCMCVTGLHLSLDSAVHPPGGPVAIQ